ncbi:hypothetical protein BGZ70_004721 [Mortierella alpina]|uniref:FAD-binding domain-containing protein n=1 Tax=Mortierella alpina TaxID=64518 RepID=A0A9P6J9V3_MORAP|nr:hypothetical protein BGZ70_004721 [Mortierella alpina]
MEDHEFVNYLLEVEHPISGRKGVPHVLISGAGLSGLFLAILLEEAGISYTIFERSKDIRPLGAIMALSANILPVFEQLGLYEALMNFAKPINSIRLMSNGLKKLGDITGQDEKDLLGYSRLVFTRPELYDLLLAKVPAEKIFMNKKIVGMIQDENAVAIRCHDKSIHVGDILVGADGAHSGVRQTLYKRLDDARLLPDCDTRQMGKGYICIVGTTDRMDAERYPKLRELHSEASLIIADDSPHTWSAFSVPGDRVCWNVVIQLNARQSEEEQFRNSEWGPEASERTLREVSDFQTPFGTLGELIASTPKNMLLPSTGQGCVNALQDAVILANCLYELKSSCVEEVEDALKDYRDQRFAHVKTQYHASQWNAKLMYGHFGRKLLLACVLLLMMQGLYITYTIPIANRAVIPHDCPIQSLEDLCVHHSANLANLREQCGSVSFSVSNCQDRFYESIITTKDFLEDVSEHTNVMIVQGVGIGQAVDEFVQTRSRWLIDLMDSRGYERLTSFADAERRTLHDELDRLQNQCDNFFYGSLHFHGFGSRWHTMTLALAYSLYHDMTLFIPNEHALFIPITSCTEADIERSFASHPPVTSIKELNSSTINFKNPLEVDMLAVLGNRTIILPKFESKGHYWWRAMLTYYAVRPNYKLRKLLRRSSKAVPPCIAIHIRHSDKIEEADLFDLTDYMAQAFQLRATSGASNIYLMTDDEKVIESRTQYPPDFQFQCMDMMRSNQGWRKDIDAGLSRDRQEETFLTDLYSAVRCQQSVVTYSSNIGRLMAELSYALRNTEPDVVSLDEKWKMDP